MINSIFKTYKSFIYRGGHYIFLSMIITKLSNFILSILILRILSESVYGNISYAMSVMQIIIPLAGFGLHNSLLRFGAIATSPVQKNDLFTLFLKRGLIFSLLLSGLIFILSGPLSIKLPESKEYFRLLSPYVISFYLTELLFSLFRIHKNNKMYSYMAIFRSVLLLITCYGVAILFGGTGYVISYYMAPLIVVILMLIIGNRKYDIRLSNTPKISLKPFISYGVWVSLGTIATQLVLLMDTIMVGNIISDSAQMASYKVATLIPANLIFIPLVLLKTDYVYIAENYLNKKFLINYYKKYLIIFSIILIGIVVIWLLFGNFIVSIFGEKYSGVKELISILMLMVIGTYLFRIPLGNILAAVGKSKWNGITNFILIFINFTFNMIFIPKYGLNGAAYASVLSIWMSGLMNIFLFTYYIKHYCKGS